MRRWMFVLLVPFVLTLCAWGGAKASSQFKAVEIKHFTGAEGVELTPEFYDFLYADLKAELQKTKLFENFIGEGEVIESADAPKTASIEGNVLEYKKGSVTKEVLIGFGAGRRTLISHVKIVRVSDKQVLLDKEIKVRTMARWDNKLLAKVLAKNIANECKQNLK